MRFLPSFLALTLITVPAVRAQLDVDAAGHATFSGRVGIGTAPSRTAQLLVVRTSAPTGSYRVRVILSDASTAMDAIGFQADASAHAGYGYGAQGAGGHVGFYGSAVGATGTSDDHVYGVLGLASGSLDNYGVFGYAYGGSTGRYYGVYGLASGSATSNIAIYGDTGGSTASGDWAGYFLGKVFASGSITQFSDARLKRDVETPSGADVLARLVRVGAHRYRFRTGKGGCRWAWKAGCTSG